MQATPEPACVKEFTQGKRGDAGKFAHNQVLIFEH